VEELPYLRLLLRNAPVTAFEDLVRAAEGQGLSATDVEHRREAMLLALQIREVLAERRRREQELSALNETASDLTATRDIDAVLRAIVRRGRQLLDSDTCYLTMIDPERGETYMRVTDGLRGVVPGPLSGWAAHIYHASVVRGPPRMGRSCVTRRSLSRTRGS
jgi:hypothetical protein